MRELGNLTHQIAAKQEGCATQTYAEGDSPVSAGWPGSDSSNSGITSNT